MEIGNCEGALIDGHFQVSKGSAGPPAVACTGVAAETEVLPHKEQENEDGDSVGQSMATHTHTSISGLSTRHVEARALRRGELGTLGESIYYIDFGNGLNPSQRQLPPLLCGVSGSKPTTAYYKLLQY